MASHPVLKGPQQAGAARPAEKSGDNRRREFEVLRGGRTVLKAPPPSTTRRPAASMQISTSAMSIAGARPPPASSPASYQIECR